MEGESDGKLRLRLRGAASLVRDKGKYPFRYAPSFGGVVVYDVQKQALERFDVIAVGEWTWDYRPGQPKETLGVALELWKGRFASPDYDRHFPGISMSNYGYKQERE